MGGMPCNYQARASRRVDRRGDPIPAGRRPPRRTRPHIANWEGLSSGCFRLPSGDGIRGGGEDCGQLRTSPSRLDQGCRSAGGRRGHPTREGALVGCTPTVTSTCPIGPVRPSPSLSDSLLALQGSSSWRGQPQTPGDVS